MLMLLHKNILLALSLFPFTFATHAHPHSWIALDTTINIDDENIISLSMEWEFDAMTSAYMLDGENINTHNREQVYNRIASEIVENMLPDHYFTYFYQGDKPVRYKKAQGGEMVQRGAKLTLSFELELAKPLELNSKDLSLLIFDPTYFVDMSWEGAHPIKLTKGYSDLCAIDIVQPHPTAEQLAYAMSLSRDEDPDYELGQLFTQRANLSCHEG